MKSGGVGVGATLTIEPGVKVYCPQDFLMKIGENGGLVAVGTESEPIVFTSETEAPKAWKGIYFDSKYAANEIAYCEFHYSGLSAPTGNIYLWYDATLNIHDTKFFDINGCAINYRTLGGETTDPNLTIGPNITITPSGCKSSEY